ncbi:FUSC family protein [Rhizobiaceae bacterium BDR2-2]|uniref:FUSC family protein n=1 Tax=Ectorhizobium quercum TaxID=2965071 RepID=A0AAE3N1T3_9HYPH|nr:FUSC family protein [Ectorhizobium quercum]MCX8998989.1 FUSC family protein [Ectorhizobium quercum]
MKPLEAMKAAFGHCLASAVAAALAYWLARELLGHPQPVFAAIAAIICLAPGVADHVKQGLSMMAGVAIGVAVGELALMIPDALWDVRLALAAFVAMMIASSFVATPVAAIQAGASALLVLLLGPKEAGFARLLDVSIGAAIGLILAFLFFTVRRRGA